MKYKMVELGTLISQAKTVRCGDGDYPVLSMTMHDGLVFQDDKFKKVIASKDRSDYKVVYRNQLVISFPIDEGVLAAQRIVDAGIVSPAYGIWDIDQEKILPEFLEYVLRCERSLSYYKAKLRGSTARRRSLPTPTLLAHMIPIPSLEEQAAILEIIHKASNIVASREQELDKLDELIKARFVEMFGDPNNTGRASENKHKIGELCDVTKLAGFEFTEYINYQDSGEIIMLRGLNCKQGKLILDNVKYIDRETSHKLPRSRLYKGDILMTYAGTIGDVAMVDEDDKYHLAPNVAKISIVDKEKVNPIFLVHLFMYSHDYIMTFASQVAQASINMQKIRDFEYIIPSIEEQNEFERFAKQLDKSKFS